MKKHELIDQDGQADFGIFPDGVDDINYLDFDLRSTMGKSRSTLFKKLSFNQFQFISLSCEQLIIGLAIVDLKIASHCFVYVYDSQTTEFDEVSFISLLALNTCIDSTPNTGQATFRKGRNSVTINTTAKPQIRSVEVNLKSGLKISACIDESINYNPLAVCVRAGFTGFHFTQKTAALPCTGTLQWRGKKYVFEELKILASVDWSAGFMRRETFWNWGSLACTLADGRRLGLNLSAGVIETGFTENALWLDGTLYKIDMVDFQFERYGNAKATSKWRLRSKDGIINLYFEPEGKRQDKTNLIIIATNFTQHFGRYYGEITLADEVITLNGEWGFTEDHYAKW